MIRTLLLLTGFAALCLTEATAELKLAPLFTDHAVLQRDQPLPVWGTAPPHQPIEVHFANQSKTTVTGKDGRWQIFLDPLPASHEPVTLSVSSPDHETLKITDVLVGEVWLCSGQSNMAMRVDLARDPDKETAAAKLPELRVFSVDRVASPHPLSTCTGNWIPASPESAGKFSATAFFFGRELHRELKVPVGLIVAAWGGSTIEAWTSADAQANEPALQPLFESWAEKDAAYTPAIEAAEKDTYEKAFALWKKARAQANQAGTEPPKAPRRPINPRLHHHHPSTLFNGMIAPLIPYAIRGAIWYQGETNALTEETSSLYELQLPLLIDDWRSRWDQGDFPFAWVQLPVSAAQQVAWARMRDSMRRATTLPNTGMAVTIDLHDGERLLHPKNKQDFAHRLALWARAEVYGEDIPASGPRLTGHRFGEKGALLRFDNPQEIAPTDDPLVGFELQDDQGDWQPATARLRPNGIVLTAPGLTHPTAARYAWANHPEANLTNTAGLPASPFTTEGTEGNTNKTPNTETTTPAKKKSVKGPPSDLNQTPFVPADPAQLPPDTDHLDTLLLIGQSNMKGRGLMPDTPLQDPRIIMLHKRTDQWFHARHPLHHVGDPKTFENSDNAGVGPGLAFAQAIATAQPAVRIALIPCAVGGTQIAKWQKGERLYEETIRRAHLALQEGPKSKTRIAGALWLQGESDSSTPEKIAAYPDRLKQLITDLRADLNVPDLPFIACTIGELREDSLEARAQINAILLDLPNQIPHTDCVDSRPYAADIGDSVHFDTPTQQKHGQQFAQKYQHLTSQPPSTSPKIIFPKPGD